MAERPHPQGGSPSHFETTVHKPTQPGIGLSKPTDRPPQAGQPGAKQGAGETSPRGTPDPARVGEEAGARSEENVAELRRCVEGVTSTVEALRAANRILTAEVLELRQQVDRAATASPDADKEIASLKQALEESERAALLERQRAANEREEIFERQDEFLAALLEERASGTARAPAAERGSASTDGTGSKSQELDRLRQLLSETQRKVARLEAERDRSREVLRRLQQQRDEAQRTVTRLTQERRKQSRPTWSDDGTVSARDGKSRRTKRSKRPAETAPQGQSKAGGKRPQDDASDLDDSSSQSPLAAALANSDPSRRKHRRSKR